MDNNWQPIETAPKDGTEILLWWPYWSQRPVIGGFNFGQWVAEAALSDGLPPTHWMRLPDPPKAVAHG